METNNHKNTIFFTILKNDGDVEFTSTEYNFTVRELAQQAGTNGKALWYYRFDNWEKNTTGLEWVSWNKNPERGWEYLLLCLEGALYSGFINQSKEEVNKYYCKLTEVKTPFFEEDGEEKK